MINDCITEQFYTKGFPLSTQVILDFWFCYKIISRNTMLYRVEPFEFRYFGLVEFEDLGFGATEVCEGGFWFGIWIGKVSFKD